MLPAQQLAASPWPPDGGLLERMDDLAHKGKGNGNRPEPYIKPLKA